MAQKDIFRYYDAQPGKTAEHVVFSPLTFAGTYYNSDARLQALATQSGFDVVTTHASGTGRIFTDRKTRKAVRKQLATEVKRQGRALGEDARYQSYPGHRIGQGLSGRSLWVAEMAYWLYQDGDLPFTHVQTCDGVNLATPEPVLSGVRRMRQKGGERSEVSAPLEFEPRRSMVKHVHAALCGLSEIRTYGHVMSRTQASRYAPEMLAGVADVPYHSILFEDGVSGGTREQMQSFGDKLVRLRTAAGRYGGAPAPLLAETLPYKHGDLMNPDIMTGLLERTVQMTDPEFRIPTQ